MDDSYDMDHAVAEHQPPVSARDRAPPARPEAPAGDMSSAGEDGTEADGGSMAAPPASEPADGADVDAAAVDAPADKQAPTPTAAAGAGATSASESLGFSEDEAEISHSTAALSTTPPAAAHQPAAKKPDSGAVGSGRASKDGTAGGGTPKGKTPPVSGPVSASSTPRPSQGGSTAPATVRPAPAGAAPSAAITGASSDFGTTTPRSGTSTPRLASRAPSTAGARAGAEGGARPTVPAAGDAPPAPTGDGSASLAVSQADGEQEEEDKYSEGSFEEEPTTPMAKPVAASHASTPRQASAGGKSAGSVPTTPTSNPAPNGKHTPAAEEEAGEEEYSQDAESQGYGESGFESEAAAPSTVAPSQAQSRVQSGPGAVRSGAGSKPPPSPPGASGSPQAAAPGSSSASGIVFRKVSSPPSPHESTANGFGDGGSPAGNGGALSGSGGAYRPRRISAVDDSWEGQLNAVHRDSRSGPSGSGRPASGARPASANPRPMSAMPVRPASAGPRDRNAAALEDLTRRHPSTWDVRDVCTWVEYIGMGQYRKKFSHHAVDGPLLLSLNDHQLKAELGIGPLGHRKALQDAIATLQDEADAAEASRGSKRHGGERPASAAVGSGGHGGSRGRPVSARQEYPRRPASASRAVIPSDAFLGPALGKVTVYEQRAKLLFELDRAQARAAQHRALADQLHYNAGLSSEEVAHLRGLLQDLERKNKAVMGVAAASSVDTKARIPWHPIGNGTRVLNYTPERYARPGDDPIIDMTFQPRISSHSRRILEENYGQDSGGGGSSFLDRLSNDLKKRERNRKEIDRKYYSPEALLGPGAAQRKFEADMQFLSEYLSSKAGVRLESSAEVYNQQIDEVFSDNAASWRLEDHGIRLHTITNKQGPAKVLAAAGAIRTVIFMDRYKADLNAKRSSLSTLQKTWMERTIGAQYLPGAREKEDLAQAVEYFGLLGWRGDGEDAITDDLLDKLLARGREYRRLYEEWWASVRDKPQERAAGPTFAVDWSKFGSDGLQRLQEEENQRSASGMDGAGSNSAVNKTKHAGGSAITVAPLSSGGLDYVAYTAKLLGKLRMDDLERLAELGGRPKTLAVYRAVRTQKFIEFTETDIKEREKKLQEAYNSMAPSKRVLDKQQIDGFFERLLDDASKRKDKTDRAMNEKMAKEQELLKSSAMFTRSGKK